MGYEAWQLAMLEEAGYMDPPQENGNDGANRLPNGADKETDREAFLADFDDDDYDEDEDDDGPLDPEKYIEFETEEALGRYLIEGDVEMHEYLEIPHKPNQHGFVEFLQAYLLTLLRLSLERAPEQYEHPEQEHTFTLDAKLTIDGTVYASQDAAAFFKAVIEKLPEANGFVIDNTCVGVVRELYHDCSEGAGPKRLNLIRKDAVWTGAGMLDTLEQYKRRDSFEYKLSMFYPNAGEFKYEKILNGKNIDVLASGTEDIVDLTFEEEWWTYMMDLYAKFDFEKHADILEKLHEIVRANLPEEEAAYCEGTWEDGELQIICSSIQWGCHSLREVQDFLDKVNEVLLPIKDELEYAGGYGTWEIRERFAVATWDWTEQGFKVKGLLF